MSLCRRVLATATASAALLAGPVALLTSPAAGGVEQVRGTVVLLDSDGLAPDVRALDVDGRLRAVAGLEGLAPGTSLRAGLLTLGGRTTLVSVDAAQAPEPLPTAVPTAEPTVVPTALPTLAPTAEPVPLPTTVPTTVPSPDDEDDPQTPKKPKKDKVAPTEGLPVVTVVRYGEGPLEVATSALAAATDLLHGHSDGAVDLLAGPVLAADAAPGCEDPVALYEAAAARAGWTWAPGRHLVVLLPAGTPGCAGTQASQGQHPGSGGRAYLAVDDADLVPGLVHALGHHVGLHHVGTADCAVDGCTFTGDGDVASPMGGTGSLGALGVAERARLGLPVDALEGVGTVAVRLSALGDAEPAEGTVRGLRVRDTSGTDWWLELRAPRGADADVRARTPRAPGPFGVRVLRSGGPDPDGTSLVDALLRGSWASPDRTVRVRVALDAASGTAAVHVTVSDVALPLDPAPLPEPGAESARSLGAATLEVAEWGKRYAVHAMLVRSSGSAAGGLRVALQQQTGAGWTTVRTGRTNAQGLVSFPVTAASSPATHRIAPLAGTDVPATEPVTVLVTTPVTVKTAPGRLRGASTAVFVGTTKAVEQADVYAEIAPADTRGRAVGAWTRPEQHSVVSNARRGEFTVTVTGLTRGTWLVRLGREAVGGLIGSTAKPTRLSVG